MPNKIPWCSTRVPWARSPRAELATFGVSFVGVWASVSLGAVFLFSGILKLRDPGWPAAARSLGSPDWAVPLVAPFEVGLGLALVVGVAEVAASAIALATLAVFTALLVVAIGRPDPPACSCFGSWSAKPVGRASVIRNVALMVLALTSLVSNL